MLEHGRDLPVVGRQAAHIDAGDLKPLGRDRRFEAADDPEQRGLARARRPQDGQELPRLDAERHMVERGDAAILMQDIDRIERQGFDHDFTRRPSIQTEKTLSATLATAISVFRQ